MNSGALDRLIQIDDVVTTQDAYGAAIKSWSPLATIWANVQDVLPSRSEAVKQGLAMARNQTRIRFRYRSDINSEMRITLFGDVDILYQIVAGPAEVLGRKKFIEVVCERYSS